MDIFYSDCGIYLVGYIRLEPENLPIYERVIKRISTLRRFNRLTEEFNTYFGSLKNIWKIDGKKRRDQFKCLILNIEEASVLPPAFSSL
jgi:hypothetical protein